MVKIENYRVKIIVDKEPGLYTFDAISATGKSYLCTLCKKYRRLGEPVAGYDYYDYLEGMAIPTGLTLLIVDRYDLYYDEKIDEQLADAAKTAVVLVDSKHYVFDAMCHIDYKNEGLIYVN